MIKYKEILQAEINVYQEQQEGRKFIGCEFFKPQAVSCSFGEENPNITFHNNFALRIVDELEIVLSKFVTNKRAYLKRLKSLDDSFENISITLFIKYSIIEEDGSEDCRIFFANNLKFDINKEKIVENNDGKLAIVKDFVKFKLTDKTVMRVSRG